MEIRKTPQTYDDCVRANYAELMASTNGNKHITGNDLVEVSESAARMYLGDHVSDEKISEQSICLTHPLSRLWTEGSLDVKPYYAWALTIERQLAAGQIAKALAIRRQAT